MSEWAIRKLGDICEFKPGKQQARAALSDDDLVSFVPMNDLGIHQKYARAREERSLSEVIGSYTYFVDGDVLLAKITPCFENGKLGIAQGLTNGIGFGSSEFTVIRPSSDVLAEYVYYFLNQDEFRERGAQAMNGAVGHKRVPQEFVEALEIPLPAIEEQRRIVTVLDGAFAAITAAAINTEKALTDTNDLFESYAACLFLDKERSWPIKCLGEVCEIARGGSPRPIQKFLTGDPDGINWIKISDASASSKYIYQTAQKIRPEGRSRSRYVVEGDFLLSNSMSFGRPYIMRTAGCIHDGWLVLRDPDKNFDQDYLYHFLGSAAAYAQFDSLAAGSTVRNLNIDLVASVRVPVPPIEEQAALARKLEVMAHERDRLQEIYRRKFAALEALKQSLLRAALSGQMPDYQTPEFTANIIAFAQRRHEMKNQHKTFGRVKAQKSLHLVESVAGIDLGRQPIKDAAGPNDFQQMLRAEKWAEAQGFFKFVPRPGGSGYDFKKLANYEARWASAVTATQPIAAGLEKAIDPIVPMKSQEAELFATVHAAWNNLILDAAEITDQAIVREARDDWHPDKLKIPAHKFHDALKQVRANAVIPNGSAKRVGGQVSLF